MLQVGIENNSTVAHNIVKACKHCCLFTKVARQFYHSDPFVLFYKRVDEVGCLIGAAIVDKEYLPMY